MKTITNHKAIHAIFPALRSGAPDVSGISRQERTHGFPTMLRALGLLACALIPAAYGQGSDNGTMSDNQINNAIESALLLDDTVPSNKIDVGTIDGIATLDGSVQELLEKERAGKIARTVRGVRSVVNTIEIDAPPRTDADILGDVEAALAMDPATDSYQIDTKVDNGKVTLSGTVSSWQEQQLAIHVAKGVMGVKEVVSDMSIDYGEVRTDEEILSEVKRALEIDVWVDDWLIDVSVNDKVVTLDGSVGSVSEKNRARRKAWVAGVTDVVADGLEVEPWLKDEQRKKPSTGAKTDDWIRKAVIDAFTYDPRVFSFEPTVTVDNGIVTLSGTVDNLKAKQAAESTAENTVGVWRVRNYLKVRPETPVADEILETRVNDALLWNSLTESFEIDVAANDGVVTLTGTVDSYREKSEAEDVAQRTNGVVAVRNNLIVSYPSMTYYDFDDDPLWDVDPEYDVTAPDTATYYDDIEIKNEIESEFFWSPFVDGGDIVVSVMDGVATLTGTVDSWAERRSATENALEGGARRVNNQLVVDY